MREVAELAECPWYVGLSTGDENAGGGDGFLRLALQDALVVYPLVQLLRDIADRLRECKLVAARRDVAEGGKDVALRARSLGTGGCALQFPCHARAAISEADDRVELLDALEEGVGCCSDTRGVVAFVVCEGLVR